MLVTDNLGNLMVYSYDPEEAASRSGRRLVRRVDMRLPSVATACLRVGNRFRHPLLSIKAIQTEINELRRNRRKLIKPAVGSGLLVALEYERTRHSVYFGKCFQKSTWCFVVLIKMVLLRVSNLL